MNNKLKDKCPNCFGNLRTVGTDADLGGPCMVVCGTCGLSDQRIYPSVYEARQKAYEDLKKYLELRKRQEAKAMRQERLMWSASVEPSTLKVRVDPAGGVVMAGAYCAGTCQYLFYETDKEGVVKATCILFDRPVPLDRASKWAVPVRCSACVSLVGTDEVAQVVTGVEVAAPAEPVVPPEPTAPPERVIATIATLNIDMDLDEDTGDKPWLK